jgi:hypothetical protein
MTRRRTHVQHAKPHTACQARPFETPRIRSAPTTKQRIAVCDFSPHQGWPEGYPQIAQHAVAQELKSLQESALSTLDPNLDRAVLLDRRMRERLGTSLRYVLGEAAAPLDLAPSMLDGFLSRLQSGPVRPAAFGAYFDLVMALECGDQAAAEVRLWEIAETVNRSAAMNVLDLGEADSPDRYCRLLSGDSKLPLQPVPATHPLSQACRRLIDDALALLDHSDPALAAEIRQLVCEVVLADVDDGGSVSFDGASSFMLWGAVMLNVRMQHTSLDMVQALVHESGHSLLFGLCADGPLVSGEDPARYVSPLRGDLRPMDGIVHATFVSARMHRAVASLLNAGAVPPDSRDAARDSLAAHIDNCEQGLRTIESHADLTARGQTVYEDVQRYLSA